MIKVSFDTIFITHWKDFEIKQSIRVNGITFSEGFRFSKDNITVGGIDWSLFENQDIGVEIDGDVFVIKRIYKK